VTRAQNERQFHIVPIAGQTNPVPEQAAKPHYHHHRGGGGVAAQESSLNQTGTANAAGTSILNTTV
jgi:hypothetical protein